MHDNLTLLKEVADFYNSSFSILVSSTFGILAFIGVFIPLVFSVYQRKQFDLEQAKILAELKLQVNQIVTDSLSGQVAELNEKIEKMSLSFQVRFDVTRESYMKEINNLKGGIFQNSSTAFFSKKEYKHALNDAILSANFHILSLDHTNLRRALKFIYNDILPKCDNYFIQNESELINDLNNLTTTLKNFEGKSIYIDDVINLSIAISSAKQR